MVSENHRETKKGFFYSGFSVSGFKMTHLTVFSSIPTAWHLLCHSHSEINMNTAGDVLQWKQNENNQKDEIWDQNKPTVLCLFVSVWDDWEENTLLWILYDAGQQFFCSFFWRKVCPEKNCDDTCCNNVSLCSSFMTLWVSVCCYSPSDYRNITVFLVHSSNHIVREPTKHMQHEMEQSLQYDYTMR